MNKNKIGILIAAIAIIIILFFGITYYQSYQEDVLSQQFNKDIQNASAIEANIISSTEKFNNQQSTNVDDLISTINNDVTPKYAEEINILNKTLETTNNDTKKRYLELQIKRIELTSKNSNATVTTLNALAQYYKGEKSAEDAQNSINTANSEMTNTSNELKSVFTDINTLLKQNPDLNQTLHGLNLEKVFYGEQIQQNQTNMTTNTTNTTQ